jgi:hypothetical protein
MGDDQMRKLSLDELKAALRGLDPVERNLLLAVSVLEHSRRPGEPAAALLGMAELISYMAAQLGKVDRYCVADRLRNIADVMERTEELEGVR